MNYRQKNLRSKKIVIEIKFEMAEFLFVYENKKIGEKK